MKKKLVLFPLVLSLFLASCSKNGVQKPNLPKNVGTDEFAGKTFSSFGNRLEFKNDGTVLISSIGGEDDEEMQVLNYNAEYRYDSSAKKLYLAASNLYVDGKLTSSLDEYVKVLMDDMTENLDGMIESSYVKIDDESKKIYETIIGKSYESHGRSVLETMLCYDYNLSSDGKSLELKEIPPENPQALTMMGCDDDMKFNMIIYGNEFVFSDYVSDPENMEQDYGSQSNVHYAFVRWNDAGTEFSGDVYSIGMTGVSGEVFQQVFKCSRDGKIKGKLKYWTEKSDGMDFYFADYEFTEVPECLKDIKKASLGDPLTNYSDTYTLVD